MEKARMVHEVHTLTGISSALNNDNTNKNSFPQVTYNLNNELISVNHTQDCSHSIFLRQLWRHVHCNCQGKDPG